MTKVHWKTIGLKLAKEFWGPLVLTLFVIAYKRFNGQSSDLAHGALVFSTIAFWFAQWNRGKKQLHVEQGLSGIEVKVGEMMSRLDEQTKDLVSNISGGDSFCYGEPFFLGRDDIVWMFMHSGKFPLHDVSVRIYNCRKDPLKGSIVLKLGTLFPGRAHMYGDLTGGSEPVTPVQAFNLFFVARNGSWTQEIRWTPSSEGNAIANRVVGDSGKLEEPLHIQISARYLGDTPLNQAWGNPPGLEKLY